jgi:hypothetical protein
VQTFLCFMSHLLFLMELGTNMSLFSDWIFSQDKRTLFSEAGLHYF